MDAQRQHFIASIAGMAVEACKGTKLFPSLLIAQACLESNDGQSGLAKECHNYFGIKLGDKDDRKLGKEYPTKEYIRGQPKMVTAWFRCFKDCGECISFHNAMLHRVRAYSLAGLFDSATPEGQANALRKAGYATDPAYPKKLTDIINLYHLKQYDPVT